MPDTWNPSQYEKFRDERRRPFFDLVELVRPGPGMRVVDLGCGTGELTRVLHDRVGARETVGIDSSAAMLGKSASFAVDGLRFENADIADFRPESRYDLVFSNAALHWTANHDALFARLAASLTADGQLAVQMPANFDEASHVVAAEVAAEEPFRTALAGYTGVRNVLAPEAYACLLDRLGFAEQHVRLQVYGHKLTRRDDVVEWVKGTLLTDYQRRMPAELFARFLDRYRKRLLPRLEDTTPYFFPFKRILIWARK
jgi:trans-aconitate 2-methyltransferase